MNRGEIREALSAADAAIHRATLRLPWLESEQNRKECADAILDAQQMLREAMAQLLRSSGTPGKAGT